AARARDLLAELLPVRERVSGAEHPDMLITRHNFARWTGEAGDAARARDLFAELLPVRERVLGAEHPRTLDTRNQLAYWTERAGDGPGR
ncbi:tetratricopeptide repeat protein, partial [Planomonospora algeriensis]